MERGGLHAGPGLRQQTDRYPLAVCSPENKQEASMEVELQKGDILILR
ncbi:MAG: hypothetical protein S4CHLAM2_09690 [Chlamydiales bacterium]|nr:hypothetical protein [Chlamydiales bacterium]